MENTRLNKKMRKTSKSVSITNTKQRRRAVWKPLQVLVLGSSTAEKTIGGVPNGTDDIRDRDIYEIERQRCEEEDEDDEELEKGRENVVQRDRVQSGTSRKGRVRI